MTGIELELISDIDIHLFIEKGMRGCTSYIYNKANVNTWNAMIVVKKVNLLFTWMQKTYMVGQWANIYHKLIGLM